jgi:uncharacterized protein (TIGR02391 family)
MAMPAPFPSNEDALSMPVDRLAMHVLWYLADTRKYDRRSAFILERLRADFVSTPGQMTVHRQVGSDLQNPAARAWAEAWEWLIIRGLVSEDLERNSDYWIISRLGQRIARESEPLRHLRSAALLETDLHTRIATTARSLFLQGLYELAAFDAMKQVEIRVRELAGANPGDLGVNLMRQAFKTDSGPLTDPNQEKGEREATAALFAGAIGTFKNPTSHRQVEYDDPIEASEVVLLADLLLRILDRRALNMPT